LPIDAEQAGTVRDGAAVLLRAFAAAVSLSFAGYLDDAVTLRRRDPYQTPGELAHLTAAVALARSAR
jgi:hypothetical protein